MSFLKKLTEKFNEFLYSNPYNKFHELSHKVILFLVLYPYYHLNYKFKVIGRENIPQEGPFLIVSNHYSYNDPTLLSIASHRANAYIAKRELFDDPKIGKLITFLGAIPINREKPGTSTFKQFKKAVDAKWSVGIFVEGTRNQSREEISRLNDGPAFMAKMGGGLNVLPIGIRGGQKKGDKLEMHIGEVIPFDKEKSLEEMTLIYGEKIASLAGLRLNIKKEESNE